ncbi:acyl-CoA synthetase [Microbacterium betulae]|uniref:Acyl-CoA synthetase n=1 Tax=Microbacterium betulae TaxID=2981139 RepID=A0AA97FI21_9MICO|nr:acyl-CoA synthetase [Microbacterium sp. AB]WOF22969.1 acyl-CoA synthetase [Microbacterium sp. AB]
MPAARPFTPSTRHVQLLRALVAAIAALMVTFSPDHSAIVGLPIFSGWAVATALALGLGAWMVAPAGERAVPVLLAVVYLAAGMVAGIAPLRGPLLYFVLVPLWAFVAGVLETGLGVARRRRGDGDGARDALTVGVLTLVVAAATLVVPADYVLDYYIEDAGQAFTLTGEIIAVGLFGGYAAIVAVFLAIAGLSPDAPRQTAAAPISEAEPRIPEERP